MKLIALIALMGLHVVETAVVPLADKKPSSALRVSLVRLLIECLDDATTLYLESVVAENDLVRIKRDLLDWTEDEHTETKSNHETTPITSTKPMTSARDVGVAVRTLWAGNSDCWYYMLKWLQDKLAAFRQSGAPSEEIRDAPDALGPTKLHQVLGEFKRIHEQFSFNTCTVSEAQGNRILLLFILNTLKTLAAMCNC